MVVAGGVPPTVAGSVAGALDGSCTPPGPADGAGPVAGWVTGVPGDGWVVVPDPDVPEKVVSGDAGALVPPVPAADAPSPGETATGGEAVGAFVAGSPLSEIAAPPAVARCGRPATGVSVRRSIVRAETGAAITAAAAARAGAGFDAA